MNHSCSDDMSNLKWQVKVYLFTIWSLELGVGDLEEGIIDFLCLFILFGVLFFLPLMFIRNFPCYIWWNVGKLPS